MKCFRAGPTLGGPTNRLAAIRIVLEDRPSTRPTWARRVHRTENKNERKVVQGSQTLMLARTYRDQHCNLIPSLFIVSFPLFLFPTFTFFSFFSLFPFPRSLFFRFSSFLSYQYAPSQARFRGSRFSEGARRRRSRAPRGFGRQGVRSSWSRHRRAVTSVRWLARRFFFFVCCFFFFLVWPGLPGSLFRSGGVIAARPGNSPDLNCR